MCFWININLESSPVQRRVCLGSAWQPTNRWRQCVVTCPGDGTSGWPSISRWQHAGRSQPAERRQQPQSPRSVHCPQGTRWGIWQLLSHGLWQTCGGLPLLDGAKHLGVDLDCSCSRWRSWRWSGRSRQEWGLSTRWPSTQRVTRSVQWDARCLSLSPRIAPRPRSLASTGHLWGWQRCPLLQGYWRYPCWGCWWRDLSRGSQRVSHMPRQGSLFGEIGCSARVY